MRDRQLKTTIADLKDIESESFKKRQRFGFYAYLDAVFAFYTAESEGLRTGFRRKPDSVPMIADSR